MINSRDIKYLHPRLKEGYEKLKSYAKNELGVDIILTSTGRDDEYQNFLYQKGRTTKGSIVTYMPKAGAHGIRKCGVENFCMAFDIVIVENGSAVWSHPKYRQIGEYGESIGFFWGGRWTSLNDVYHFQMTDGLKASEIIAGKRPSWWLETDDITGHWAEKYIRTVIDKDLMSGYPDGSFKPDSQLTRAEMCVILVKLLEKGV